MSRTPPQSTTITENDEGQLLLTPEEPLPERTRRKIALNFIRIEAEAQLSSGPNKARIEGLKTGIRKIGLLQCPALEPLRGEPGYFRPVYGNRRTIALRQLGIRLHEFDVYAEPLTQEQRILASQMENANRSMNWVHMVTSLFDLIERGIAVSEKQLVNEYGFDKKEVGPYLKLAQLPAALVEEMRAGHLGKGLANKITRLPVTQQQELARLVTDGAKLTEELVDEVWTRKSASHEIDSLFQEMETLSADPHSGGTHQKMTTHPEERTVISASELLTGLLAWKAIFTQDDQQAIDRLVTSLRSYLAE